MLSRALQNALFSKAKNNLVGWKVNSVANWHTYWHTHKEIQGSHSAKATHDTAWFTYRAHAPPNTYGYDIKLLTFLQAFVWFYLFRNVWYDTGIMLGHPEFEPPDPTLWTDEELGIPPDDYTETFDEVYLRRFH